MVGTFDGALVNLDINDIGAGIRFYRDLLGLVEPFRTPAEGTPAHVELGPGMAGTSGIPAL